MIPPFSAGPLYPYAHRDGGCGQFKQGPGTPGPEAKNDVKVSSPFE